MTLDAMHWVWKHSQSKGNARVALLYVADQVRTSACEVRLSYAELMEAMNTTSKGTVSNAITTAEKLGELVIVEEGVGRRAAVYRLPKAVNYVRPAPRSGPETGPQDVASGPETGPLSPDAQTRSGPETGPQKVVSGPVFDASGPETGPLPPYPNNHPPSTGEGSGRRDDPLTICQPLIDAMTNDAQIVVSWQMQPQQWMDTARVVQRAGVEAMVGFARDTRRATNSPIRYATFFLRGWMGLPPRRATAAPPQGTNGSRPPHCGDLSCDPDTRLREVDRDGLPELMPCPECHPTTQRALT